MRRRWVGVGAAVVALFGLGGPWAVRRVETDLTARAGELGRDLGVEVRFEGRDAQVTGTDDAVYLVAAEVERIEGVRAVHVSKVPAPAAKATGTGPPPVTSATPDPPVDAATTTTAPAAPDTTAATLAGTRLDGGRDEAVGLDVEASLGDRTLTIDGRVPAEIHRLTLEAEAARAQVVPVVESALVVSDGAGSEELDKNVAVFASIIRALGDNAVAGRATLVEGVVTVAATAKSDVAAAELGSVLDIAEGFGLVVTREIDVATGGRGAHRTQLQDDLDAIAARTTFEYNRDGLSPELTESLTAAVAAMRRFPDLVVVVEGHTDDVGPVSRNRELSEQRARIVVDHLVAEGVDRNRLRSLGLGESQPIADNRTPEGQAANRRIAFRVVER